MKMKTPEERQRTLDEPHMKACLYAAKLVSGFVETRDETVRKPLVAMSRRIFEEVMGIRKRDADRARVEASSAITAWETILEVKIGEKLDVAAQSFLGKLTVAPIETLDFTEHGHGLSTTAYELPEWLKGLHVQRLTEEDHPNARYQLVSSNIHVMPD